ncbi:MAG: cell division protein ZapA [Pseudomonadota bacterium]
MPSVSVTINGKNYRMACDEGQEAHLEMLARELDKYVDHLKGSFGDIGDQRLTVMAGVMVTDELIEVKKKLEKVESELAQLKDTGDSQTLERQEGDAELTKGLNDAAAKIEELSKQMIKGIGS